MAKKCEIGFEVSKIVIQASPGSPYDKIRSVVFYSRANARKFQRDNPGAKLQAVELCEGRIKRRGKRSF